MVDGLIGMMESDKEFQGPVNLGNPNEFTMLSLAEQVISLTNSKSRLIYKDLPEDRNPKNKENLTSV